MPALTTVIIGDRGKEYLKLHYNIVDRHNQNRTEDRDDIKMKMIPPPPPIVQPTNKMQQVKQPQTEEDEVHNAMPMQAPPSPSTLTIQLPAQQPSSPISSTNNSQLQNRYLHHLPLPPPSPLAPNN